LSEKFLLKILFAEVCTAENKDYSGEAGTAENFFVESNYYSADNASTWHCRFVLEMWYLYTISSNNVMYFMQSVPSAEIVYM